MLFQITNLRKNYFCVERKAMQVKINVRNSTSCGSAASTPSSAPGLLSPIMVTNNKSIPQKTINNLAPG